MATHTKTFDPTTPIWLGKTCRIRPFRPSDAAAFYDFAKLPEVSRYMNWPPHASVQETAEFLAKVCASQDHDIESPWAIVSPKDDVCCGFVGYSHFCADHRRADLAIALHPAYGKRGIAQEACGYLLQHAKEMGLIRVQAVVEEPNVASCKLMERLGGSQEALMKHYIVGKGGITDAFLYAFLIAE